MAVQAMTGCSSKTVRSFEQFCRQLIAGDLEPEDTIIGGEGIVVEIDECKLGKRKYNRGHRVDGVWVLAGVERTIERRLFLIPVPDRSSETLLGVIGSHVRTGSVVMTDLWKGYSGLEERLGITHTTVNHSKNFRDPVSGTCTNTIEGTHNGVKMTICPRRRTKDMVEGCLWEFIWRRKNSLSLWDGLLNAMRDVEYVD